MTNSKFESGGLTTEEVKALQQKHGKNEIASQKKEPFAKKVLHSKYCKR